jgi:hypothetical protein
LSIKGQSARTRVYLTCKTLEFRCAHNKKLNLTHKKWDGKGKIENNWIEGSWLRGFARFSKFCPGDAGSVSKG